MRSASWVVSWEAGGEGANEEIQDKGPGNKEV